MERAIFRPSAEHANPCGVRDFMAEVFCSMDAFPRKLRVRIDFSEASVVEPIVIDLLKGEPVFFQRGAESANGRFDGRWLAEHVVPLRLPCDEVCLSLAPAGGNRVRVKVDGWFSRRI